MNFCWNDEIELTDAPLFLIANGDASDADANNWIKSYCSDLKKASAAKQVTVGALSGWCAGFVFTKFGKTASAAIGGSLILLHVSLSR